MPAPMKSKMTSKNGKAIPSKRNGFDFKKPGDSKLFANNAAYASIGFVTVGALSFFSTERSRHILSKNVEFPYIVNCFD